MVFCSMQYSVRDKTVLKAVKEWLILDEVSYISTEFWSSRKICKTDMMNGLRVEKIEKALVRLCKHE